MIALVCDSTNPHFFTYHFTVFATPWVKPKGTPGNGIKNHAGAKENHAKFAKKGYNPKGVT